MSGRTLLARWASVAGIALLAMPAVNCFDSSPYQKFLSLFSGDDSKSSVVLADHYVVARGAKHNDGFTVRSQRTLWPPFELDGSLGLYDPKHADLGPDGFGVSVINSDILSAGFAGLTVTRSGDGIQVAGNVGAGATTPLVLPTALEADFKIVHDGTNLIVSARAAAGGAFTELGRAPNPVAAYKVSLDGGTLPYKTVVGYDNLRLVDVGRRPGLTPIETLQEDVYVAADALAAALVAIDGPSPDVATAAAQLAAAHDDLDGAVAEASGDGAKASSVKAVKSIDKKVASALAAVQADKKPSSLFSLVYAAAQAVVKTPYKLK